MELLLLLRTLVIVKNMFTEELIGCNGLVVGEVTDDQFNSCIYEICELAASEDNSITCSTEDRLENIAQMIGYYVDEYTS